MISASSRERSLVWDRGEGPDGLLISAMVKAWLLHRRKLEIHLRSFARLPPHCSRPVGSTLADAPPQITPFPAKPVQALCGFVLGGSAQQERFCCSWAELEKAVAKAEFCCSPSTDVGCPWSGSVAAAGLKHFGISCCRKLPQKLLPKVLSVFPTTGPNPT